MPFIVDASVALAWCFEDEANAHTEAVLDLLADDTAIVPSLWEREVCNVLLLGECRRRLTESQTTRFIPLDRKLREAAQASGVRLIPDVK